MTSLRLLPTELHLAILSHLDFPNLITCLTLSKYFHTLINPITSNPSTRLAFLLDYETSAENQLDRNPTETFRRLQHLYLCHTCHKLFTPLKFATGKCFRLMLGHERRPIKPRFCLSCGIATGKYRPGSMVKSWAFFSNVHLCGGCGEWTPEFFCMRQKLCFPCTERALVKGEEEKWVEGFVEAGDVGKWCVNTEEERDRSCVSSDDYEMRREAQLDVRYMPQRPPCCRACGGGWRFSPILYSWGGRKDYNFGYLLSGRARREPEVVEGYMANFVPWPMTNPYER